MNKRLMTLVTMMAVTGSILAAPVAMASDTATQTQAGKTVQEQAQVQIKTEEESPIQTALKQQFRFRSQQARTGSTNGPNFEDKDGNGVCDNLGEDLLPERKMDGTGQNGTGQNFIDADKDGECDNFGDGAIQARDRDGDKDGTGDKIQTRQGRPDDQPAAPTRKTDGTGKSGDGGQNFVDADKDGECDNLGTGGTPERKLDGSGSDGEGKNFVDADNDGTCDNLGDGPDQDRLQDGTGSGSQTRQGARKGR